jgi:hypothetical protein
MVEVMGIQRVKQLTAEAEVCGQTRLISWDVDAEGTFVIVGVKDYEEVGKILRKLEAEQPVAEEVASKEQLVAYDNSEAVAEVSSAASRGTIPLAVPVTQPVKAETGFPKFDLPATGMVPKVVDELTQEAQKNGEYDRPKGGGAAAVSAAGSTKVEVSPTSSVSGPQAGETASGVTGSATSSTGPGDLSVFANMTRFADVVAEVRRRLGGSAANEYAVILARCVELQAIGDVCPPLDSLLTGKGPEADKARLEDRLKTHMTTLGLAVPK